MAGVLIIVAALAVLAAWGACVLLLAACISRGHRAPARSTNRKGAGE